MDFLARQAPALSTTSSSWHIPSHWSSCSVMLRTVVDSSRLLIPACQLQDSEIRPPKSIKQTSEKHHTRFRKCQFTAYHLISWSQLYESSGCCLVHGLPLQDMHGAYHVNTVVRGAVLSTDSQYDCWGKWSMRYLHLFHSWAHFEHLYIIWCAPVTHSIHEDYIDCSSRLAKFETLNSMLCCKGGLTTWTDTSNAANTF